MATPDEEHTRLSLESLQEFMSQFGEISQQEQIALEYILELIYAASNVKESR